VSANAKESIVLHHTSFKERFSENIDSKSRSLTVRPLLISAISEGAKGIFFKSCIFEIIAFQQKR
jgi:hypothetical protein